MELKIIYEDENLLVIDKPPRLIVFPEKTVREKTLIDLLLEKYSNLKNVGQTPRYGVVHRLDKDTSGILLVAKNNKTLKFLQKQFRERQIEKRYLALVVGKLKNTKGTIETLLGREPKKRKKQKVYLPLEPEAMKKGLRKAVTEYKILRRFSDNKNIYTLLGVYPKTGRKHQIRVHLAYIDHPIAGDKMYGFKNQPCPKGLQRQFLHASYLKMELPNRKKKEFKSDLSRDLKLVLENLNQKSKIKM